MYLLRGYEAARVSSCVLLWASYRRSPPESDALAGPSTTVTATLVLLSEDGSWTAAPACPMFPPSSWTWGETVRPAKFWGRLFCRRPPQRVPPHNRSPGRRPAVGQPWADRDQGPTVQQLAAQQSEILEAVSRLARDVLSLLLLCLDHSVPPRPLLVKEATEGSRVGSQEGCSIGLDDLRKEPQSHLKSPCSLSFGSFSQWAQALPRLLLRTRSSFSRFLLKTFCLRQDDDASISTALFPLPLLCDGLFEKVPQPFPMAATYPLRLCGGLRRLNSARFLPVYVGLLGRAAARQGRYLSVQAVRAQLRLPFFPTSSHTLGRPALVPLRTRALRSLPSSCLGLSLSVPKLSLTPLPALILIAEGTGTSPAIWALTCFCLSLSPRVEDYPHPTFECEDLLQFLLPGCTPVCPLIRAARRFR